MAWFSRTGGGRPYESKVTHLDGTAEWFDRSGKKTGESRERGGRTVFYDSFGNRTGYTERDALGRDCHYDSAGRMTGYDRQKSPGVTEHFDAKGKKTGVTRRDPLTNRFLRTDQDQ